jgi:RNA polymerase sigma factor (sigma-70 family)
LHEQELIKALKEGSAAAFSGLVQQYKDKIYNTALGFVQQAADAEEITQNVFVKVYERIGSFNSGSALGTWLYRITVRQSLDYLRARKRRKRFGNLTALFGAEGGLRLPEDFNHPGVVAENKERAVILFKAIAGLPDSQKTAYLLQKLEGLPVLEIAAIMKTSAPAVESLLSRAKANLKKSLTAYYSL